jgi:hypothetical protein
MKKLSQAAVAVAVVAVVAVVLAFLVVIPEGGPASVVAVAVVVRFCLSF